MTRYGRKRRRLSDLTPRVIDEMRRFSDLAELDRHDAEQEAREPREDPDYRRWLSPVDPDDFDTAA